MNCRAFIRNNLMYRQNMTVKTAVGFEAYSQLTDIFEELQKPVTAVAGAAKGKAFTLVTDSSFPHLWYLDM